MGTTACTQIFGSGLISADTCSFTKPRSICFSTREPRRGSNPYPVMLVHPASFNFSSVSLALMIFNNSVMSLSDNFEARDSSISAKSRTFHSAVDRIALPSDGIDEDETATANIARDGLARYVATFASIPSGKLAMHSPHSRPAFLRLLLPHCTNGMVM